MEEDAARDAARVGAGPLAALIALLIGLAVLDNAAHVLFFRGGPSFDLMVHYRWAMETARAVAAGDPYPHWMAEAALGLGEPALRFYAPLYYLAAAWLWPLTGNSWAAMHIVEVAANFGCGWFAYLLARDWAGHRAGVLAGVLGVLSPMAIMIDNGFNGFPWAADFAFVAYLFWAMLRPGAAARRVNGHAILALALVIATHTLTGLLAMIALSPLALLVRGGRIGADPVRMGAVALVFAGGLALSAVYLLPALALKPLIAEGVFKERFTPWSAFVLPTFTARVFGVKWLALQVPIPLAAFGGAGLSAFSILRAARGGAERWLGAAAAAMTGVAAVLALEISYPLWVLDTPLRFVQFPFRFTTIPAVLAPPLIAIALARPWPRPRWLRPALRLGLGGTALLALALIVQTSRSPRRLDVAQDRLGPYPGLPEYQTLGRGPAWKAYAQGGGFGGECARMGVTCSARVRDGAGFDWAIDAPHAATLRLPAFDFPALALSIDGQDAPHRLDRSTGLIAADLPAGAHRLRLRWSPLPVERAGAWISAVALGLLLVRALALAIRPPSRVAQPSLAPAL